MVETREIEALTRRLERLQRRVDALEAVNGGQHFDAVFRSFMAILGPDDPDRWLISSIAAYRAVHNLSAEKIARALHVRTSRVVTALKQLRTSFMVDDDKLDDYLKGAL
jgi:hypothetical protein